MNTETAPKLTIAAVRASGVAALTRSQVAELLGVDGRTVSRSIEEGSIPSLRLGRRLLIPTEAFLRLLDAAPGSTAA